ncbi:TfoX/Sxy family protein [Fulvivirga sp. M361]|uniref:TfoX/Sxy family protein n=1 Tax=Fulvivirga sp. M361 TaxID=2594266 RepID=UPI00117B38F0|nr:TfoX/Sxy family protein [Fulvivirga sp. M361]TRX58462.1 TfoX/Sxy family protein [Fulvivirga sp. M361]
MAFDEFLADRVRTLIRQKNVVFEEKKMMGGLCIMVNDKMCVGVIKNQLMARIDPDVYDEVLDTRGSKEMDFTGRAMKGFLFIKPEGIDMDSDLEYWVDLCLEFNPKAKSSKKKAK